MTLVLGGLKLALVAGQLVMKAFNASLTGLGAAAGIAVGALGAVLAAVRELQAAQMAPLLKSVAGTMPGVPVPGKGSYKSSTGVVGNLMADKRFGMFSDAALTGMMSARAQAGQRVDAPFRNQLARLADFSGGDEKALTSINQAMINGAKAGKVTGEVYQELQKSAPALAKAFQEMTGGEEAATKAADAGTMSFDKFNEAIMKGELEALKPYNGALNEINNTVMGKLKGGLRTLKEDLTDLGSGAILDAVRAPIDGMVQTISNSIFAVAGAIQTTLPNLLGGVGNLTTTVMEKLVKYIIRGMTAIDGFSGTLNTWVGNIRQFFGMIGGYLTEVTGPWDQFSKQIIIPLIKLLGTLFNEYLRGFDDALQKNGGALEMWKGALEGLDDLIKGIIGALNVVKSVLAPIIGVFLQLASIFGGLLNTGVGQFVGGFLLLRMALNKSIGIFQKWKAKLIETFSALQKSKAEMDAAKASMDPLQRALDMVNKRISEQVALLKQATNEWRQMMQFQQLALPGGKPQSALRDGRPMYGPNQRIPVTDSRLLNAAYTRIPVVDSRLLDVPSGSNSAGLRKTMRDRIMANRWMQKQMNSDVSRAVKARLGYYRQFHKSMYTMDRQSATPWTLAGMKDWARRGMPAGSRESQLAGYRQKMSSLKANAAIGLMTAGGMIGGDAGAAMGGIGTGVMLGQMTGARYGGIAGAMAGGGLALGGMIRAKDPTSRSAQMTGGALQYGLSAASAGLMVPGPPQVKAVAAIVLGIIGTAAGAKLGADAAKDAAASVLDDRIAEVTEPMTRTKTSRRQVNKARAEQQAILDRLNSAQRRSKVLGGATQTFSRWNLLNIPRTVTTREGQQDSLGRKFADYDGRGGVTRYLASGRFAKAEKDLADAKKRNDIQGIKEAENRLEELRQLRKQLDADLKENSKQVAAARLALKEFNRQEASVKLNMRRGIALGFSSKEISAYAERNNKNLADTALGINSYIEMSGFAGQTSLEASKNIDTLRMSMEDMGTAALRATEYFSEEAVLAKDAAEQTKRFNKTFADFLAGANQAQTPEDLTIGLSELLIQFNQRLGTLYAQGTYGYGNEGFATYLARQREGAAGMIEDIRNRPGVRPEVVAQAEQFFGNLIKRSTELGLPQLMQMNPETGATLKGLAADYSTATAGFGSKKTEEYINKRAQDIDNYMTAYFGLTDDAITAEQVAAQLKIDMMNNGNDISTKIDKAHRDGGAKAARDIAGVFNSFKIFAKAEIKKDGTVDVKFTGAAAGPGGKDGQYGGVRDTSSPRRQFAKSMASHSMFNNMVPGSRNILSGLRSTGLGSPSSDHRFGYAYDLTGQNLGAYASLVKASGGFAEFHGGAGDRHLHVVPPHGGGDTMTPMRSSVAVPSTGGGAVVNNNSYSIVVNGGAASPAEIADEVMMRIRRAERNAMERA